MPHATIAYEQAPIALTDPAPRTLVAFAVLSLVAGGVAALCAGMEALPMMGDIRRGHGIHAMSGYAPAKFVVAMGVACAIYLCSIYREVRTGTRASVRTGAIR